MSSATLKRIDAKLERLDPESLRFRLLSSLRQFRASWIELGRLLNQVALDGDYKEWGYEDFDLYCARELGLKRPTVQKLMVSYNYMRKHEPNRLDAYEDALDNPASGPLERLAPDVPDYQTIDLLDRARRRSVDGADGLDENSVEQFHRRLFDRAAAADSDNGPGREEEEAELRKELRERLRPPPRQGANDSARELAGVLRLSRQLREKIAAAPGLVPDPLRQRLEAALAELETLA